MWNILFPHVTHCLSINVPLVKSTEYQIPFKLQLAAQTLNQNYTQLSIRTYNDVSNHNISMVEQYRQSVFLGNMCGIYLSNSHSFQWRWKTGVNSPAFVWLFFKNFTSNIFVSTKPEVWKYDSGFEAFKYYRAAFVSDVCFLNFETPLERKVIFWI